MTLKYGYQMESSNGGSGHVVLPPLLSTKITLSSTSSTNRWIFCGTRREILNWMREHKDVVLENAIFPSGKPASFHTHTEIVIDLQYVHDPEQSTYNYCKSFFVDPDYEIEKVRVELRPRLDSKDQNIETLSRVIVTSGTRLGDIDDELEQEWYKPGRSYYQQAVELFSEGPPPVHVVSADPPASVRVEEHASST